MSGGDSLRTWLREQISAVLNRKGAEPPFIIWCDPERVWKDLLLAVAEGGSFEVWADDTHEILVRDRFHTAPRAPRVIWLPVSREDIGYMKVFELQAAEVKDLTLPEALSAYGVDIPSDQMADLKPLLAAHTKEWFDRPLSAWEELTPGNAKGALIDDDRVLEVLATPGMTFDELKADNRFGVFARRLKEDFGLPAQPFQGADSCHFRLAMSLAVETWPPFLYFDFFGGGFLGPRGCFW